MLAQSHWERKPCVTNTYLSQFVSSNLYSCLVCWVASRACVRCVRACVVISRFFTKNNSEVTRILKTYTEDLLTSVA